MGPGAVKDHLKAAIEEDSGGQAVKESADPVAAQGDAAQNLQ